MDKQPWKVSLHGGHSAAYCDHAADPLRALLEAAVARGFSTYGVTEHAPRLGALYLFRNEIALGWDVAKIARDFDQYCEDITPLAEEFGGRLAVLRGFEVEVVPEDGYVEVMRAFRARPCFDFCVGSVHFLEGFLLDGEPDLFDRAVEACGGLEPLAVKYYAKVAEMVAALEPEVVAHLDIIRRNGQRRGPLDTPPIRAAARKALEVVRDCGCILEVNTSTYRKGIEPPFPAPWLVRAAHDLGIPLSFGDDSHAVAHVGAGIEQARRYLLENGVGVIATLAKDAGKLTHRTISLDAK